MKPPPHRRHRARHILLAPLLALAACAGSPPPQTPVTAEPVPELPVRQTPPPSAAVLRLANGVTVHLRPHRAGAPAQIQLGILAGTDFGQPGLAELAAQALLRSHDAASGRVSLQQTVTGLGGTVGVDVGPLSTSITLRVPQNRWPAAVTALTSALTSPAVSRSQIERIREEYVLERIQQIQDDANAEVAHAFRVGHRGTADYVATLLERDASEVSLFTARLYRPDSAIVTVQVPGREERILTQLAEGIGQWPVPIGPRQVVPVEERRLRPGIHWAPGEGSPRCHAMLVLPLPDLAAPHAAELLVLHACLTLDGIGGRLEKLQRERGLGRVRWSPSLVKIAGAPALVLGTDVAPVDAVSLWQTAEAARKSLLDLPPTRSELDLAIRRAALTAQLLAADAASQGQLATALALRGQSLDSVGQQIAALGARRAFRARFAALLYLEQPAALVVIGGQPPVDGSAIERFELLPPGAKARIVSPNPEEQAQAAAPWLAPAFEAVGGADALRRLQGHSARCALGSEASPDAREFTEWNTRTGELTRERTVMGATIVTRLGAGGGSEESDEEQMALPAAEVARIRRELRRHPLELLAAAARGDLRFRPVAQRTVADRDLMVLETLGDAFDRLRIHIDTVSSLIRVVEVWETTAEGTYVHLRDAWSDYRSTGTLRAPFRRITEVDDGRRRVDAVWSEWQPRLGPAQN